MQKCGFDTVSELHQLGILWPSHDRVEDHTEMDCMKAIRAEPCYAPQGEFREIKPIEVGVLGQFLPIDSLADLTIDSPQ